MAVDRTIKSMVSRYTNCAFHLNLIFCTGALLYHLSTMAKFDTSNPSGFPEFSPAAEAARQNWVRIIEGVFRKYGFLSITTPLVEREENLLGKGGNAKEMYALKRVHDEVGDDSHSGNALRFDHTVPLALYVARNFNDLTFPFKRSVIGPVFRGERAQKGRFRQFDQCDIDIIGNEKLDIKNDALVVAVIAEIFEKLKIGEFVVGVNNRKILTGMSKTLKIETKAWLDLWDERDKLSPDKFQLKLRELIPDKALALETRDRLLKFTDSEFLEDWLSGRSQACYNEIIEFGKHFGEESLQGARELVLVLEILVDQLKVSPKHFVPNLFLARGLDYYTGTVYETQLIAHPEFGSVCSGGRYDDLASVFTNKKLPGVGISIGLTRLFSQCLEAGLVKPSKASPTEVLLLAADEAALPKLLEIGANLRSAGIVAENYLEGKKLAKQFDYADKLQIPYCLVMGERELEAGQVQLKNMETGEQETLTLKEVLPRLRPHG